MKKILLFIILFAANTGLYSKEKSKITDVIVYRQGAKVTRQAVVNLAPGNNEVILDEVTMSINNNILQVKIEGDAVLLSATSRNVTLEDENIPYKTKNFEDSIYTINKRIKWLTSQKTVYEGEEKIIYANQKLGTDEEKISVDELVQLSSFYRDRLLDIREKVYDIDTEIEQLNLTLAKIQQKLNNLQYSEKKTKTEIVISVSAKKSTQVKLSVSYLTPLAGWTPVYDVRANGADKPLTLVYKANVFQTTGFDWKNALITISTGNPTINNNRPIMNPWYISFTPPYTYNDADVYRSRAASGAPSKKESVEEINLYAAYEESIDDDYNFVEYNVTETTNRMAAEYKIDAPQDIPSDGQVHLVAMQQYELAAKYSYHAVPKLDQTAYMMAKVADYGKYNLLPGNANLFFEGMYIGQSYLNPITTVDSMLLSLGQDSKITILRNRLQDFSSKQVIGSNIKETKGFEIILRNNNSFPIEMDLLDQIPISSNKEMEVTLDEYGEGKFNKDYGSIMWKLNIKPGETKKVRFVYTVKYPKNQVVYGL
ncbi:MAG: DUF4139 domain-containing protein [Bacteroidales bacterium]|nr:DUF4139 domain-containing protein [Bacteroidales bacterium]